MPATFIDKILLLPVIALVLFKTVLAIVNGPFRSAQDAPTYSEHVLNTLIRSVFTYGSIEQIQWIVPPFLDTYKSWCSRNKVAPDIVDIPGTRAKGFWLGSKSTAKCAMIWFHGGGFVVPGNAQHIDLGLRMIKWSNNQLAIFFVDYSLSPSVQYPVALSECVEGVRYVLDLPGHSSETTLIGGDSAGGALVFVILSHLSHPHPQSDIVKPLSIKSNLKGGIAIAPWPCPDRENYPSVDRYASRDTINHANSTYYINAYKGGASDDEYIYSVLAPSDWWKDVKVDRVLLTVGEEEILVDSNKHLAEKFKQGAGVAKIKLVVGEREVHEAPLMAIPEARLVELGERIQEGGIKLWVKEELR